MSRLFITFEGCDGSGKSTQSARFADRLRNSGHTVVEAKDPGGTVVGQKIRHVLLTAKHTNSMAEITELLLYEASRAQLVREVIRPALAQHAIVVCDRFTDSTVAYQGYGRGLNPDLIHRLNTIATDGLTPDITFLFDLDPARGLTRCRRARDNGQPGHDRIEAEPLAFHRRIRDGYLTLARMEPNRIHVINAELDRPGVESLLWTTWTHWLNRHTESLPRSFQ